MKPDDFTIACPAFPENGRTIYRGHLFVGDVLLSDSGMRGHPPADLEALRELLLRISRLAVDVPEIVELDLNPVLAMSPGNGCRIVDARIKVRAAASSAI